MPAKSKAQHGIMGMALAYKRGKMKESDLPARVKNKIKQIAASMSEDQLKEYTSTGTRGLPKRLDKGQKSRVRKVRSA